MKDKDADNNGDKAYEALCDMIDIAAAGNFGSQLLSVEVSSEIPLHDWISIIGCMLVTYSIIKHEGNEKEREEMGIMLVKSASLMRGAMENVLSNIETPTAN